MRECAPRLSSRPSAERMVAIAQSIRFSSSIASTRAVLKVAEWSAITAWFKRSRSARTFSTPSRITSSLRNTEQWSSITLRSSRLSGSTCSAEPSPGSLRSQRVSRAIACSTAVSSSGR